MRMCIVYIHTYVSIYNICREREREKTAITVISLAGISTSSMRFPSDRNLHGEFPAMFHGTPMGTDLVLNQAF